jgi:hypothetical protein
VSFLFAACLLHASPARSLTRTHLHSPCCGLARGSRPSLLLCPPFVRTQGGIVCLVEFVFLDHIISLSTAYHWCPIIMMITSALRVASHTAEPLPPLVRCPSRSPAIKGALRHAVEPRFWLMRCCGWRV